MSDPARVESALRTQTLTLTLNERLRSAFITDAMDELRTPLAELEKSEGRKSTSSNFAAVSISDLLQLIDDIRELAALDSDKEGLKVECFDFQAAITTVRCLTK